MKRKEGFFKGYKQCRLFYQEWLQEEKCKGLIILTHGQGEHSEAYLRLINGIQKSLFHVIAWDWRGHGKSDGKRGYAQEFLDYEKDYEIFLNLVLEMQEFKNLPIVLLGHSMGGLIQTSYLSRNSQLPQRIKAQILSSPLFGLSVEVPPIKDTAARIAKKLYPTITLHNELKDSQFSRDPYVLADYPKDPLRHHKISPGVYLGFLEEFKFIFEQAHKISIPTLLQLAEKDSVVSTPIAEKYFLQMGSPIKKVKVYPERYHEIYNDLGREEVFADILGFLEPIKI